MPIYKFKCNCDDCKTEGKTFETLCFSYKEVENKTVECPGCKSTNVDKQITNCYVAFAKPEESSRYNNFEYQAQHRMAKAKEERRFAEQHSHMGSNPHPETNDLEKFGEGIFDKGEDYE